MKKLTLFFTILLSLATISCDDNTESIGVNLIPDENIIVSRGTVFETELSNFEVDKDSVYSKSTLAYLGMYNDDMFGYLETGYMTQLYCLDNFSFDFEQMVVDTIKENGTDREIFRDASCYISIDYTEFFGDSLNPCEVEVYKLNKSITGDMNSSVDPSLYYDEETDFLGKVTYTAANTYIEESERDEYRNIFIKLDDDIAQRIIMTNREHPEYFKNAATFNEKILKGLYLKPTGGDGTVIYVQDTRLYINFTMYVTDSEGNRIKRKADGYTDKDSTALYTTNFNSTREVYQVNTFENTINEQILNDKNNAYLKSPAGIFTSVKIPVGKIYSQLKNDTIMQIKLTLQTYNQSDDFQYNMSKPENVLLVKRSDVYKFFYENRLPDNKSSYIATLQDNTYSFSNISQIVSDAILAAKERNNGTVDINETEEVIIVPVTVKTEQTDNQTQTTSVRNNLMPQYAKIQIKDKEGNNTNRLEIMHIRLGK